MASTQQRQGSRFHPRPGHTLLLPLYPSTSLPGTRRGLPSNLKVARERPSHRHRLEFCQEEQTWLPYQGRYLNGASFTVSGKLLLAPQRRQQEKCSLQRLDSLGRATPQEEGSVKPGVTANMGAAAVQQPWRRRSEGRRRRGQHQLEPCSERGRSLSSFAHEEPSFPSQISRALCFGSFCLRCICLYVYL